MNERSLKILSQLTAQLAINDARVRSDPLPYLQEAHHLVSETRELLEQLEWVLEGMDSFDMIQDIAPKMAPVDFNGEALLRCQKALRMIREFKEK